MNGGSSGGPVIAYIPGSGQWSIIGVNNRGDNGTNGFANFGISFYFDDSFGQFWNAVMAQIGMARAINPVHTPLDGDVVFAAATGHKSLPEPVFAFSELGMVAANVLARAIARGIYEASALPFPKALPSWKDKFG